MKPQTVTFIAQIKKVEAKPDSNGLDIMAKIQLETPNLNILNQLAGLSTTAVKVTIEPDRLL